MANQRPAKFRRMRKPRFIAPGLLCLGVLSACGAAYHSASVDARHRDDPKMRVVAITAQSLLAANARPHNPRPLPEVFRTTTDPGAAPAIPARDPEIPATEPERRGAVPFSLPPVWEPEPYTIGIGDVIALTVPAGGSVSELAASGLPGGHQRQSFTVQSDGAIAIPDAGRVKIAGMTLDEAEAGVFSHLVAQRIEPAFSLEIEGFNSASITVGGAVRVPQVTAVTLVPVTLAQALARAGDTTEAVEDTASIRIYRDGNLYQIPLGRFRGDPDLQNLWLKAGDTVYVDAGTDPEHSQTRFDNQLRLAELNLRGRAEGLATQTAEAGLRRAAAAEERANYQARLELGAEPQDYVYLTGEIARQGRFPLPPGQVASLADAIYGGGGGLNTGTASMREIYVLRSASDPREFGAVTAWHLDARNAANLSLATRFELRPDDVIFAAEHPVTRWGRVVKQITPALLTAPVAATAN